MEVAGGEGAGQTQTSGGACARAKPNLGGTAARERGYEVQSTKRISLCPWGQMLAFWLGQL